MSAEHDLEMRLRINPDDTATWLVYADVLQQRNDPRGELIILGERAREGDQSVRAKYAERCRAMRWPRDVLFPRMNYRARFEALFDELRTRKDVKIREARIVDPDLAAIERWRTVAGEAWPIGMTELYSEVSQVDLEWAVANELSGCIHIPPLSLWDYAALENELWFDFCEDTSPLHRIRPIDRFTAEAYTVLYLRNPNQPAEVAYHYCGESLVPTALTYRDWLELLFRSRGVAYWIQLALGPAEEPSYVGQEGIDYAAQMFADFDPRSMSPSKAFAEVRL